MNSFFKKLFSPEVKCDSALEPIPKEYYFDDLYNYIQPIDKKFIPYPDIEFINSKLIPHFTESLKILNKNICSLDKEIEDAEKIAQQSMIKSQEFFSTHYEVNFLNQNIIRKLKILVPKMEEINRSVIFTQISYLEQRIKLLKNIEKITNFFITSPHYYYINLNFIQRSDKLIKVAPEIYFEYNSIKQQVDFLKTSLSLITEPFLYNQENVDFTIQILSHAITLKIPDTKCVQITEELDLFKFFLESSSSPIHFTLNNISPKDIDIQITMMANCLLNFCLIDNYDDDLFDVLYFLLIQFFFEIFIQNIESSSLKIDNTSQIINSNLDKLKESTLEELGISSQNNDFANLKVTELFERNSQLRNLHFELLNCHFLINPIEIFFAIRKIEFSLKSVFTNSGDLRIAWKALLIYAAVPSVNLIFEKLANWKDLRLISDLYEGVCEIPNLVIDELKNII